MSTLCQFTEGFFFDGLELPPRRTQDRIFLDLVDDVERRITIKLFDANRTLRSLVSENRRTVEVDSVHQTLFDYTLAPLLGGRHAVTVRTLDHPASLLPVHALVRRPSCAQCIGCQPPPSETFWKACSLRL